MLQATDSDFTGMLGMLEPSSLLALNASRAGNWTGFLPHHVWNCWWYMGVNDLIPLHRNFTMEYIHVADHECWIPSTAVKVLVRLLIMQRSYMAVAIVALLHDHAVTFIDEVNRMWTRRQNIITVLFFLNRYIPALLYIIIGISLASPSMSYSFCGQALPRITPVLIVFSEAIIGILLMLKVRALWRGSINAAIAWIIAITYVVELTIGIMVSVKLVGGGPIKPGVGCFLIFNPTTDMKMRLVSLWFINILFHVMIFACTLKRTIIARYEGAPAPLGTLLLRDGAAYFLILVTAKVTNLILLVFHPEYNSVNWAFNHVFDVMLTSRLLLNLRRALSVGAYNPVNPVIATSVTLQAKEKLAKRDPEAVLLFRDEDEEREGRPGTIEMLKHILHEDGYNWKILDVFRPHRKSCPSVPRQRRWSKRRYSI